MTMFEKIGTENDEGPLNIILKSWIWDQYLPESMKWKCGNMG